MVTAVIFDWDGTLADTKTAVVRSFQKVLTNAGCQVSDQFIFRLLGIGTKNTMKQALQECNIPFDDEMLERLVVEKVKIQTDLTGLVELFDGATQLLDALIGRVKIALATMSGRKVIDKLLLEKNLQKYFDTVVTADEISKPKPDPEIFLSAASLLGVSPEDCVVVEDSVFGVKAARAAKMRCIAVPSGAYSLEELEKECPDLTIGFLCEKQKIFDFIFDKF